MKNLQEIKEMIEMVENANSWDELEVDFYTQLCESLGLDYKGYDNPDEMFDDVLKAYKELKGE